MEYDTTNPKKRQYWEDQLDVVNCAGYAGELIVENVYICPAKGASYTHRRCQYFGMYKDKRVSLIASIKAVVDVESQSSGSIRWKNVEEFDSQVIATACEKIARLRRGDFPKRIFLLGQGFDTNFIKDSPGGMFASKQYFDVERLGPVDARDLAAKLRGVGWSRIPKGNA
jgi:hypothetical protein